MNSFILYSIEIAVCLALFYSAYWIFLKNETFFKLNRFYLVLSVVVSLLVPTLNISLAKAGENSFIAKYFARPFDRMEQGILGDGGEFFFPRHNKMHPERDHTSAEDKNSALALKVPAELSNSENENSVGTNWNLTKVIAAIYFFGSALFLLRFLANFFSIFSHTRKNRPVKMFGLKVVRSEKNISPYSFLNFVFIGKKEYPDTELNKIISHEKVHIEQKHSLDLILFELLLIFQWFNPVVWSYKRAIKITHEYLADEGTLNSGIDLPSYQYSLLNQVLNENNIEFASTYNLSVKKRISMMMKRRSSKFAMMKLIVLLPIFIFLFGAFGINRRSLKEKEMQLHTPGHKDTTIKRVEVPQEYLKMLQGEYESTNEPGRVRRILFNELLGDLFGSDDGYTYSVIPVGDGKFINPDDHASLVFDTKDKNNISLLLFGKINLVKVKPEPGEFMDRSMAFTLMNTALKDGNEAALARYKGMKDSSNIYVTDAEFNIAGSQAFVYGKLKESEMLLKLATEISPTSFNTYDSYAEVLLKMGKKDSAIENYKKSLQLNPGNENALKRLKEMGINTDDVVKIVKVSPEYLKSLEGDYISTNQNNWLRWIKLTVEKGELTGWDEGYHYRLIPIGDDTFINPDDGVHLVFDTKKKNEMSFLIFGVTTMKKVKTVMYPSVNLADHEGTYLPAEADTKKGLGKMYIVKEGGKLYRFIETEPETSPNRKVLLEPITENIFHYSDNSRRTVEFVIETNGKVSGTVLRRPDGTYTLTKQR
jgi:tetratricopeptide (TPR) repeat protein